MGKARLILVAAMALSVAAGGPGPLAAESPYFRFGRGISPGGAPGGNAGELRVTGPSGTYLTRVGRVPNVPAPVASLPDVAWSLADPVEGVAVDPSTGRLTSGPAAPGTYRIRLAATATDASGNVVTATAQPYALTALGLPVALSYPSSTTVPSGGAARVQPAVASNLSPLATYSVSSGPAWLAAGAGGVLTGTAPAAAGQASFTVTARDFDGETATSAPFTVSASGAFASIGAQDLRDAVLDVPASMSFEPRVGLTRPIEYAVVAGRLPDGMALDAANDRVAGRPREAGTFPGIVVVARDARGVSVPTPAFTVSVARPSLAYSDRTVAVGQPFEHLPSASHLTGASYSVSPPLPDGQSIDPATGRISGRMDASQPRTYVVSARTPWSTVASNPFTLSGATAGFSAEASASAVTAHVGHPVSVAFRASVAPVTWAPGGTPLPDGLSLDRATGHVSGTVNAAVTVTGATAVATSASGQSAETGPVTYRILPKPAVANADAYFARVGQPFDVALSATNVIGTPRYALDGILPAGLRLTADGHVSGTPEKVGEAGGLVAVVTDGHDGASGRGSPFTVKVTDPGVELAVEGVQDAYRVRVGRSLSTTAPRAVNATGTPRWSMDPSGTPLPGGLSLDGATGVISGIPAVPATTAGHVLRVSDGDRPGFASSGPFAVMAVPELAVTGVAERYGAKVAAPINLAPVAENALGAVTWELSGGTLPRALSFDPGSGEVAGAPLVAGSLPVESGASGGYVLRAVDSFDGTAASSRGFGIDVQPGLVVMAPNRYRATVGLPFSTAGTAFAAGATGPVGWSLSADDAPSWLALDGQTGVLSGTPAVAGTVRGLRLVARSGGDTGSSAPFDIEVVGGLKATAPGTVTAHRGKSYGNWMTATATGALGTVTWSVAAGNLPPGMALNPATGTVSGAPAVSGRFTDIRLRAADASGQQGVTDPITFAVGDGPTWPLDANRGFSGRMGQAVAINVPPAITGAVGKVRFARNPAVSSLCLFWGCTETTAAVDPDTGVIRYVMDPANKYGNSVRAGAFVAIDEAGGTAASPYDMGFRALGDLNFYDCYSFGRYQGYCWSDAVAGVAYSAEAPIEDYFGPLRWEVVPEDDGPGWLTVEQSTGRVWGTPTAPGTYRYALRVTDIDGQVRSSARAINVAVPMTPPTAGRDSFAVRHGVYRDWRPLVPAPAEDFDNVESSWKREAYQDGALQTGVGSRGLDAVWAAMLPPGEYLGNNVKAVGRSGQVLVDYTYDLRVYPPLTAYYTAQSACLRLGDTLSLAGPRVSGKVGNVTFGGQGGNPVTLPEWMTLDAATGSLGGTPSQPSHKGFSYIYLYPRDDADGYVSQTYVGYTISVYDRVGVNLPPRETLDSLRTGTYAQIDLGLTGDYYAGALSMASGELPPGMVARGGRVEGYPERAGVYTARLSWDPRTCGSPPFEFDLTLVVNATDRPYGTLPQTLYFRQDVYGQSPSPAIASPDGSSLKWGGYLYGPAEGLNVDPGGGFVYGTPVGTGVSDRFRLYANGSPSAGTIYTNFFEVVVGARPAVTLPEAATAHLSSGYSLSPAASDFVGPVAWSIAGTLPRGMSFDTRTGTIGGAPAEAGTFPGIVVTGTETEAPRDANGVIQALQSASSRPLTLTVAEGPSIAGIADVTGRVGEPAALRPSASGLVGAPRWSLVGTLPEGTLELDRDTGALTGTPGVPVDATVRLLLIDRATNATATSEPFRVRIDGTAATATWRWGDQVCTYACTASGCSGRQAQTCEGPGCAATARGCSAPYAGTTSGTSNPKGQEATSCEAPTYAPNESYCPSGQAFAQWLYWPTAYQTKNTAGFIVASYQLGCFGTSGLIGDSECGPPPTTVTSCRMNGYGRGWCDPGVKFADGLTYNGYSTEAGWYD